MLATNYHFPALVLCLTKFRTLTRTGKSVLVASLAENVGTGWIRFVFAVSKRASGGRDDRNENSCKAFLGQCRVQKMAKSDRRWNRNGSTACWNETAQTKLAEHTKRSQKQGLILWGKGIKLE
jgi:hypothetical protein